MADEGIDEDLVWIDHVRWPFAFIMERAAAIEEFDTGWLESDFFSVEEIMTKATAVAIDAGGIFKTGGVGNQPVRYIIDKTGSMPRMLAPGEFYDQLLEMGEGAYLAAEISQDDLLRRVQDLSDVTASSYVLTTGLLTVPGGIGAAAAELTDTTVETIRGSIDPSTGVAVIGTATAGALLHLHFARAGRSIPNSVGRTKAVGRTQSRARSASARLDRLGKWKKVNEAMSARGRAYQYQITGRSGQAYIVGGVKNGVLLDAKGPGYVNFVKNGRFQLWFRGADKMVHQAKLQIGAAGGRSIQWHVAERKAALAIRNLLRDNNVVGIDLIHAPVVP
ncbi:MAG: hypothetical protein GY778_11695 [bacterium]|nr:hypothetical protein [bacterium]